MSKKTSTSGDAMQTRKSSVPSVKPLDGNDKGQVRLFVYGSLKRGHHNNGLLQRSNARFMGFDTITGPFRMVSLGGFPGVVYDERVTGATSVFGEVYHFTPDRLQTFDWLEGCPNFYNRTKFRTDFMDKKCWMYHLPYHPYATAKYEHVASGCWTPNGAEKAYWANLGIHIHDNGIDWD